MKMLKYHLVLVFIIAVNGYDTGSEQDSVDGEKEMPSLELKEMDDIETVIEDIENTAAAVETPRQGLIPLEQIEEAHAHTLNKFNSIAESIQDSANAYKFLNANGVERIVITNIGAKDERIIKSLLTIIKTLFDVVPITSKVLIPTNVVDKLLDIFEDKENIELKGLALDIMQLWLPNNPKIQARVMKIKGLEPFYNQISKLDGINANKLLDLFNNILEEHIHVLHKMQKTNQDHTDVKIYEKIGLIDRMSTPIVCNGLLNIFELSTSKGITLQIFKLLKNVQKFCSQFYKGRSKAIKFFDDIYEYLTDKVLDVGMNITEEKEGIKKYVDYLKITRNEL